MEKGIIRYIGITNDFARRQAEHLRASGWEIEPYITDLSRNAARAVEQVLIEYYGLDNLYNKINSIAPSNTIYQGAIGIGKFILGLFGLDIP